MKKLIVFLIIVAGGTSFSTASYADSQVLGTCLLDSLNGKERKLLVKWIFFSISAHPELNSFMQVTQVQRNDADKEVGTLITRLFVEDCPAEAKAAQKADPLAIQRAFELVGQVAMQEIMANQAVLQSISNYVNYADQSKINALFAE